VPSSLACQTPTQLSVYLPNHRFFPNPVHADHALNKGLSVILARENFDTNNGHPGRKGMGN
jgi:hypothetical protein